MNEVETTEILNDIEKDKITSFANDKVMFEAVKKYLLVYLYKHGTAAPAEAIKGNLNWAMNLAFTATNPSTGVKATNEELGADLRAMAKGIQVIESGFIDLAGFKSKVDSKDVPAENPAL